MLAVVKRRKREKKLQIPKTELYDGGRDSEPTYRQWNETVNGYPCFHRGIWEDDADLITIVGAFMMGKARDWFDNRARPLRANRKVKYSSNVLDYIEKLEALNLRVGVTGLA